METVPHMDRIPEAISAMTNSDEARERAAEIVDAILSELDDGDVATRVEEAVEDALSAATSERDDPVPAARLHSMAAELVRIVQMEVFGREISEARALDEAVSLLEHGYSGADANGYDAAVLDASDDPGPGPWFVLRVVADSLKASILNDYTRSVVARHIDPQDWPTRSAIAAIVFEYCGDCMDPRLRGCPPYQFAHTLADLLMLRHELAYPIRAMISTSSEHPS